MTPEELAHWRYRLSVIEDEQKTLAEGRRVYGQVAQDIGAHTDPATVRWRQWCESFVNDATERIGVNTYLLQEARYKIELGKVMIGE